MGEADDLSPIYIYVLKSQSPILYWCKWTLSKHNCNNILSSIIIYDSKKTQEPRNVRCVVYILGSFTGHKAYIYIYIYMSLHVLLNSRRWTDNNFQSLTKKSRFSSIKCLCSLTFRRFPSALKTSLSQYRSYPNSVTSNILRNKHHRKPQTLLFYKLSEKNSYREHLP